MTARRACLRFGKCAVDYSILTARLAIMCRNWLMVDCAEKAVCLIARRRGLTDGQGRGEIIDTGR